MLGIIWVGMRVKMVAVMGMAVMVIVTCYGDGDYYGLMIVTPMK